MRASTDITGRRFGKLVVLRRDGFYANGVTGRWLLRCDCGQLTRCTYGALNAGQSKQCNRCRMATLGKHRQHNTRLYRIWSGMKTRCQRPSHVAFERYGGRGIKVCDEWQNFEPFASWARANGYADHLQLDRLDNDAGYCPSNCRFVEPRVNVNNRACTIRAVFDGIEMAVGDAALKYGVSIDTLRSRIRRGMSPDEAVAKPGSLQVEYQGRLVPLCELATRFGLNTETLRSRIKRGWSIARALETAKMWRGI